MRPIRILLVEDNPANLKLAEMMLTRIGCQVDVAVTGKEAVEKFINRDGDYDLIFMDIFMPEMNGMEATRAIREKGYYAIPIIALTAVTMESDLSRYLDAGMDDWVSKPFVQDSIGKALEKWVDRKVDLESASALSAKSSLQEEEYSELLGLFIQTGIAELQELEQAIEQGKTQEAKNAIHSLKGGALNFGFEELVETVEQIEKRAQAGRLKDAEELMRILGRQLKGLSCLAGMRNLVT